VKYEIDTIPVWDALRASSECPLCLLEKRSRQAALRYYLGPSVMVPEVRVTVNATGFSPATLRLLAKDPNKLGLALISHTRLKSLRATLAKRARGLGPGRGLPKQVRDLAQGLRTEENECLVEAKVQGDLGRYAFTLVHLWKADPDFRNQWATSPGTCLHHAPELLDRAADHLSPADLGAFVSEYFSLMDRNLERVEDDLLGFTQTFDATHSHPPRGNPQGALDRGLQKVAGVFPEYEDESRTRKGPLMGPVSS